VAWSVYLISSLSPADIGIFVVFMLIFLGPVTAWLVWTMLRHDSFVDRLADAIGTALNGVRRRSAFGPRILDR